MSAIFNGDPGDKTAHNMREDFIAGLTLNQIQKKYGFSNVGTVKTVLMTLMPWPWRKSLPFSLFFNVPPS